VTIRPLTLKQSNFVKKILEEKENKRQQNKQGLKGKENNKKRIKVYQPSNLKKGQKIGLYQEDFEIIGKR
jgi:hypothetical protein